MTAIALVFAFFVGVGTCLVVLGVAAVVEDTEPAEPWDEP